MGEAVPESELLAELRRVAVVIGGVPAEADVAAAGRREPSVYAERFGSWADALDAAGFAADGDGESDHRIPTVDLLVELDRLREELGRPPTAADMADDGAYAARTYGNRFGSWSAAVDAVCEDHDPDRRYSESELLDALGAFADDLGRTPTKAEMRTDGPHSPSTYADRFGTWTAAIEAAGLVPRRRTDPIPDDELLAELRTLADELGHSPREVDMNERGRFAATTYHRHFGSWTDALERADLEPVRRGGQNAVPDGELLDALRDMADVLGRAPTAEEMREFGPYSAKPYRTAFGSWTAAVAAAGLDPAGRSRSGRIPDDALLAELRSLSSSLGRTPTFEEMNERGRYSPATYQNRFGSWSDAVEAADLEPNRGATARIPTKDLLADLHRLADALGRVPRKADADADGEYAGTTYLNRFGSWRAALRAAGMAAPDADRRAVRCDVCGERFELTDAEWTSREVYVCSVGCRERVDGERTVDVGADVLDGTDTAFADLLDRLATAREEAGDGEAGDGSDVLLALGLAVDLWTAGLEEAHRAGRRAERTDDGVAVVHLAGGRIRRFVVDEHLLRRLAAGLAG